MGEDLDYGHFYDSRTFQPISLSENGTRALYVVMLVNAHVDLHWILVVLLFLPGEVRVPPTVLTVDENPEAYAQGSMELSTEVWRSPMPRVHIVNPIQAISA